MRIFVALDLAADVHRRIETFLSGIEALAPDARWARPESLHITLKFIGEMPEDSIASVRQSLAGIVAPSFPLHFEGYGFFPNPRAARVFWIGIRAGHELLSLAGAVDRTMSALGVPGESHPFQPHLTLARARGGSGAPRRRRDDAANSVFQRLQEKLSALPAPDFGTMTAREFFLYQSRLSPAGSRYTKIAGMKLH